MDSRNGRLLYAMAVSVSLAILVALLVGLSLGEPEAQPPPWKTLDASVPRPVVPTVVTPPPASAPVVPLSAKKVSPPPRPELRDVNDLFNNRALVPDPLK